MKRLSLWPALLLAVAATAGEAPSGKATAKTPPAVHAVPGKSGKAPLPVADKAPRPLASGRPVPASVPAYAPPAPKSLGLGCASGED